MSLLYPTVMLRRAYEIDEPLLHKLGVSTLMVDVDNTLAGVDSPTPHGKMAEWLERMANAGFKVVLLSNNKVKRVKPFADSLKLEYMANGMKPLPISFRKLADSLGVRPCQVAVVGDQILTDILGGNLFGAKTILVEPLMEDGGFLFNVKRGLEIRIIRRYRRKVKQNDN